MANITKIKAKDPNKPQKTPEKKELEKVEPKKVTKKVVKEAEPKKEAKKVTKKPKSEKKVFILFRPFCAFGRYLRESWKELRQVRWPNRKATWKMVIAVLIYSAIFMLFILLLDTLFTFIFNQILA